MNNTYAKIKKNSRSQFFKPQPARASLIFIPVDASLIVSWQIGWNLEGIISVGIKILTRN